MDATVTLPPLNPLLLKLRHGVDLDPGDRTLLGDAFRANRTLDPQQDIVRAGERMSGVHLVNTPGDGDAEPLADARP